MKTMIKHVVTVRHYGVKPADRLSIPLIKRCVKTALNAEKVSRPCDVSILITDDSGICDINSQFRGICKPTDVLSFPMLDFETPGWTDPGDKAADLETGLIPLGEVILSAERVAEQARKYGNSGDRETAYLIIHSVLHLLGYDHTDEAEEKKLMREREEDILSACTAQRGSCAATGE